MIILFGNDLNSRGLAQRMSSSSLTNRIVTGGVTILVLSLLSSPIGYFIRLIASRGLSIEEYGLLYAAIGFFNIFAVINDLGFGYSLAYLVPKFLINGRLKEIWLAYAYDQIIELGSTLILSLVLIKNAAWLSLYYFKTPAAETVLYIFCIYFIANSFVSAIQKLFTGLQKEQYYASIEPIRLFFTLGFSILCWLFDWYSVIGFAASWAAGYVIVALVYGWILSTKFKYLKHHITWNKPLFFQMFSLAIPSLLTTSLSMMNNYSDTIILTLIKGVAAVGIYNVIYPTAAISMILISPVQMLFLPLVAELMEKDKQKLAVLIGNIFLFVPLIGLYFGGFIFLFPESVISVLFGTKWVEVSVFPLKILSLGYGLTLLANFLSTVASGLGMIKERLRIVALIVISNVLIGTLLTFRFGVTGIVISHITVQLLACILLSKTIFSSIPFVNPFYSYFKLLGVVLVSGLIFYFVPNRTDSVFNFVVLGFLYTLCFFGITILFKVISPELYKKIILEAKLVVASLINRG